MWPKWIHRLLNHGSNRQFDILHNFLHRNQYCIWFSDRCNYQCTYCCNKASPHEPQSPVENSPDSLIQLFKQVDPGVILVSGGEPTLWKTFPVVLDGLPQHYWVILSNLSFIPKWYHHPNIKMIIPAYHEGFAKRDKFTQNLAELRKIGKRHHVKLIVKPGEEYNLVPLWEEFNGNGSLTSFVPLEFTYQFSRSFLEDVIHKYRTCSLYNSRFFRADAPMDVKCFAGSKQGFQVNANGNLVRCSTVFEQIGPSQKATIEAPAWNTQAKYCNSPACYCEWHHWGQMALANDNAAWSYFIETGKWKRPSEEELLAFIRQMRWDPAGRNTEGSQISLFPDVNGKRRSVLKLDVIPAPASRSV